jgi:hypothetical protein
MSIREICGLLQILYNQCYVQKSLLILNNKGLSQDIGVRDISN